jgi:N-acetylated-alpha-linked acidic dipeptidase
LAHLIKGAAVGLPHPTSEGRTLWDARTDDGPFTGDAVTNATIDPEVLSAYIAKKQMQASDTSITPLGSGSDYTVFLQRLGVS